MTFMSKVSVRYIVADVDAAIAFYTGRLGFQLEVHPAPGFARLSRASLLLLLDVIGEIDRQPVASVDELERAIGRRPPGTPTLLLVHRDDGDLYITLGS